MSFVSKQIIKRKILESKEFRDAFVLEHIRRQIPYQVRAMRKERGWSQIKAGEALGKPQGVISRFESRAYGKMTLQTLLEIASGFDCGLLIKFVPFSRLVKEYEDVSPEALSAKSVSDKKEKAALNTWALEDTSSPKHGDTTESRKLLKFPISETTPQGNIQRSEYEQAFLPGVLYPKLKAASGGRSEVAHQEAPPPSTPANALTDQADKEFLKKYATLRENQPQMQVA